MKKNSKKQINRIFHPWWDWECHKAGFFNTTCSVDDEAAKFMYRDFLKDLSAFARGMERVLAEWPNSCEQWLSNTSMNRIAWMGQAAMCISTGIPSKYRGGFKLLSEDEQTKADALAQQYIDRWEALREHNKAS